MGTLNEDLTAIKEVEDTIIANKVANFAYTDEAYEKNLANGVIKYNVNNAQNIPTADPSVLKVNNTVLSQGYRAQASSITRMLMNHFLGRLSYNVNKVNDGFSNLVATLIKHRGTANGFATLDENGRIPYSQLPESAAGDVKTVNNISPENGNIPLTGENIPVSSTDPTLLSAPLTTDRYANSSVTTEKIADNAVTNAKIKGPISVDKGGTGASTAMEAQNNLLSAMPEVTTLITDESNILSRYNTPSAETGTVISRKVTYLWEYIKTKISSVLGLTASNYGGTSAKATADGSGNNIEKSYALKKGGSSDFQSNIHYFKSLGGWSDFEYVVIPILEITSSIQDYRFSNGKIFGAKYTGFYKTPYFEWYCNKLYNGTASEKYFLSVKGIYLWNVVTFIYNSKKYLGIAFNANIASLDISYFDGYASSMDAPLFTIIKYYHTENGVINQEIYNSLTTVTDYSYSGFADTATNATNATDAYNAYRGMVHTCTTDAGTASKTVSIPGFTLTQGACIRVLFTNGNNIANPTLDVNNTGAKEIRVKQGSEYVTLSAENGALGQGAYSWDSNTLLELWYNGTYWIANENAIVHENLNSELGYLSSRVFINGRKKIWGGTSPYDIAANESKVMTISSDLPINDDISNHSLSVITEIESTYVNAYGDIKLMDNTLKFSIYSRNLTNNSYRVKTVHIFVTGY